jgi:glycosyltransferase involved in cell wall biosynthesis
VGRVQADPVWHGYLLGGTGSNVYTRSLARMWSRGGHEVVVFCQEPHPERYDVGGATVVRPDASRILPVYVLDRYEDLEARRLPDLSADERNAWVERNAAAVREHLPADVLVTNHVLLGAPVGVAARTAFAVKAHGSELEFALRGNPELVAWARATLPQAREVYAGSAHIRRVLEEVVGEGEYLERVRIVPPGVDVDELRPEPREEALAALVEEARRDPPLSGERHPDPGNAERFAEFLAGDEPTVLFVGKLSREKGVDLLLDALERVEARAVIVGFGPLRAELEARTAGRRVLFSGPLEHRHLAHLWPLADVSVTPSVFPEAFGMVSAEAAACGSPPLVARHSGLADVAAALEAEYPPEHRELVSFASGEAEDLAAKLEVILGLPRTEWEELSKGARRAVTRRFGWERIGALILSGPWEKPSA